MIWPIGTPSTATGTSCAKAFDAWPWMPPIVLSCWSTAALSCALTKMERVVGHLVGERLVYLVLDVLSQHQDQPDAEDADEERDQRRHRARALPPDVAQRDLDVRLPRARQKTTTTTSDRYRQQPYPKGRACSRSARQRHRAARPRSAPDQMLIPSGTGSRLITKTIRLKKRLSSSRKKCAVPAITPPAT